MITSDPGEMFNEHGCFTHGPEMYDELLRMTLIVKAPGIDEHKIIDKKISLMDLAPTI